MSDFAEAAPPVIVGGDGPYVIDQDGRRLLDCVSGLFTTQIGYSHGARIGAAAATQLERLGFYPNWAATHPAALALTDRILGLAPAGLTRLFLTSGGSESVESAWKLARQHHLAKGRARPPQGDRAARRLPRLLARSALADRHPRCARAVRAAARATRATSPTRTGATARSAARPATPASTRPTRSSRQILAEGPDSVAMVIVEPVQNAGGCLVPPPGYAKARPRDLRPLRRPALLRRGDHGLRTPRRVVRLDAPRLRARHHHERQGHDLRLRAARRRAVLGSRSPSRSSRRRACTPTATPSAATRSRARSRSRTSRSWTSCDVLQNVRDTEALPRVDAERRRGRARRSPSRRAARASSARSSSSPGRAARTGARGDSAAGRDRAPRRSRAAVPRDLAAAHLHARARRRARRGPARGARRGRGSPQPEMLLYDSPVSGNCYKVRLLLAHLGIPVRAADDGRRSTARTAPTCSAR